MKKFYLSIIFLSIYFSVNAQSYYYYHGERIIINELDTIQYIDVRDDISEHDRIGLLNRLSTFSKCIEYGMNKYDH